ncbi:hypothetical protein [Muricoccus radiodurans]|uniref:hypothetical protein n=1 Tax=Muricoccus radiodurans TaxID=2231721 RepID=UPI003CEF64B3
MTAHAAPAAGTVGEGTFPALPRPRRFLLGPGPLPKGYVRVLPETRYSPKTGYGWVAPRGLKAVERDVDDPFRRAVTVGAGLATLRISLPPGAWRLSISCGDGKGVPRGTTIRIAGAAGEIPSVATQGRQFTTVTAGVEVAEDPVDVVFSPDGAPWAVNSLVAEPAGGGPTAVQALSRTVRRNEWKLPPETGEGARAVFAAWRAERLDDEPLPPTGLSRRDYLNLVVGSATRFAACQDAAGFIVDPYSHVEFQYATPCFAYAAALAATEGDRPELLEPALRAFLHASDALSRRAAATGHEDFYPSPLAHAYRLLAPRVPAERLEPAVRALRGFDPYKTYRKRVGGNGGSGSNWNCKALSGEYLLSTLGLREGFGYAADSLLGQGKMFSNEHGLYGEGPTTYDAFPRAWLGDMLAWGYDGPARAELEEALDRGALGSLLLQSPTGELAPGGRSAHHTWPDAAQCVIFEIAAARALRAGDAALAGIHKRAARRALAAIRLWRRPEGDLQVVKNRAHPSLRHGFEHYSMHANYNLLAATALGYAYEHAGATEAVAERPTPAEVGHSSLRVGPPIDKFVANAGGTQAVIATAPTPRQTPRGLIRVHFADQPSSLAVGDGSPPDPVHELPEGPRAASAIGLAWHAPQGTERDLDGHPIDSLAATPASRATCEAGPPRRSGNSLLFTVEHRLEGQRPAWVREHHLLRPGELAVTYEWADWDAPVLLRWPVFSSDGEERARLDMTGSGLVLRHRGGAATFLLEGAVPLLLGEQDIPFRNGFFRVAEARIRPGARLVIRSGTA